MKPDMTVHKGSRRRPVVVFIHGLAMDKNIWLTPLETRAFARNVPLRFMAARSPRPKRHIDKKFTFGHLPENVRTLWGLLQEQDFNLVCWSQRRPVGPIAVAVNGLGSVMRYVRREFRGRPVAFVCHSRGGLVARKFLERPCPELMALITISTPHAGSSLSRIGKYITPLAPVIGRLMPEDSKGAIARVLKSIKELVDGNALKELMPDSEFIRNLSDSPSEGIHYLSFGGRKTEVVNLYRWVRRDSVYVAKKVLTLPDSLLKYLPESAIPDELRSGRGDIMVTTHSARMPWASEHYTVSANHFTILWNRKVLSKIEELLLKIGG
jgi:pimeloyl-ACP methyl ester carboxylesterase